MVSYLCGHNTIFGKAWNGPPRIWIVEFFYCRVSLQPVSIEAKMWMYSFLQYMSNYSCNTYEYDMTSLHHNEHDTSIICLIMLGIKKHVKILLTSVRNCYALNIIRTCYCHENIYIKSTSLTRKYGIGCWNKG